MLDFSLSAREFWPKVDRKVTFSRKFNELTLVLANISLKFTSSAVGEAVKSFILQEMMMAITIS